MLRYAKTHYPYFPAYHIALFRSHFATHSDPTTPLRTLLQAFTVVSGFLFLRFFAPAVLSPKLFGMREELADAQAARTLTLLAKALMSVGNLGMPRDRHRSISM